MAPVNSLVNRYEQISRETPPTRLPGRVRVKRYDMPMRQSTLSFARGQTTPTDTTRKTPRSAASSSKQITPPAEDLDEDTIVVKIPDEPAGEDHEGFPLPTPSESVTDTLSSTSDTPKAQSPVKSRSKRVSEARRISGDHSLAAVPSSSKLDVGLNEKLRNISGDTLVPDASVSQTSLVKNGIDKLDLKWNMDSEPRSTEKEEQMAEQDEDDSDIGNSDTIPLTEKQGSSTKQKGTKRVKIEEKNQKWEDRKKSAEQNATRRSSRASMLVTKATEVISEITSTVLGKRARGKEQEQRTSTPTSVGPDSQHPAKKARPSTKNEATERQDDGVSLAATSRALKSRTPRDKKWLISGLYAGQSRTFDPTKSEGQNKRKSNGAATSSAPVEENTVLPLPMFAGSRLLEVGRDFRLPFDVFSPLPPGQPKPDEWRRVNKNVFVGDAAAEWRTNKFSEQSTCLCRPENGCDSDCMNRFMYYECDSRNCNLSEEQCGNRAFEGLRKRVKTGGQYNVGVEVLRTADRGYGVRACRTFEPNQIIVEYTGEIINQEECESRMHGLYKDNECYYLMAFDQNMIIDATRGSIARFVNHSCAPNCRMEKWTVGGKPRMALFASDRGIMTGEELTYDYNFDPYSQKNVQVCRCGADNCRGVLGPKPKELPKKEKESALAGAKRKIAEVIEEGKEMMTGNKKRKTEEPEKKLPKGWVYLPAEDKPKSTKARKKSESEEQTTTKDKHDAEDQGSLSRKPSKLKRMISAKSSKSSKSAKSTKSSRSIKGVSISVSSIGSKNKMKRAGQRVISTNSTSSEAALIKKKTASTMDDEDEERNENEEWEDAVEESIVAVNSDSVRPKSAASNRSKSTGASVKVKSKANSSGVSALKARAGSIKGRVGRSLRGR